MFLFDKFKKKMSLHYRFIEIQAVFVLALFEVFIIIIIIIIIIVVVLF